MKSCNFFLTLTYLASSLPAFSQFDCPTINGNFQCTSAENDQIFLEIRMGLGVDRKELEINQNGKRGQYQIGERRMSSLIEPFGTFWSAALCHEDKLVILSGLGGITFLAEAYSLDLEAGLLSFEQADMNGRSKEYICERQAEAA